MQLQIKVDQDQQRKKQGRGCRVKTGGDMDSKVGASTFFLGKGGGG